LFQEYKYKYPHEGDDNVVDDDDDNNNNNMYVLKNATYETDPYVMFSFQL